MPGVWLREWHQADREAVESVSDDAHVLRWSDLAELGAERWIAEQRKGARGPSFVICESGRERALGKVALRMPGHASPATTCAAMTPEDGSVGELSYWVVPSARGRGIATAGVRAMLSQAHDLRAMRSVVLDIEVDNLASRRLADKLGAERREPTRVEHDRHGIPRTLAVHVIVL
jgi:RimJ/RimL family protein N-acetyltransferase